LLVPIAYPFSLGAGNNGAYTAPEVLAKLGLLEALGCSYFGDSHIAEAHFQPDPTLPEIRSNDFPEIAIRNFIPTLSAIIKTANNIIAATQKGGKPILIGGDHSQLIASTVAMINNNTAADVAKIINELFGDGSTYSIHLSDSKQSRSFRATCFENEDLETFVGKGCISDKQEFEDRLDSLEMTEMTQEFKAINYPDGSHDFGIIQIDAHTDCNTPLTSPSGNIHGMSIATVCGLLNPSMGGIIKPENVVFIGTRSMEMAEIAIAQALNMKIFSIEAVKLQGLAETLAMAKKHLQDRGVTKCLLSIDIDGFDPDMGMHATGAPVKNGIDPDIGIQHLKGIAADEFFAGFDITEYHPTLDDASRSTGKLIIELVKSMVSTAEAYGRTK